MRLELPGLRERPRAAGVVALVRLLPRVGPHVGLQVIMSGLVPKSRVS